MIRKSLAFLLFGSLLFGAFAYSQFSFADLSFSEEFGTQGNDEDEFDNPTDLAINNSGDKLYVVDSENNRIKIYELTGGDNCSSGNDEIVNDEVCFDEIFGSSGSGDGRFDTPSIFAYCQISGGIKPAITRTKRTKIIIKTHLIIDYLIIATWAVITVS